MKQPSFILALIGYVLAEAFYAVARIFKRRA